MPNVLLTEARACQNHLGVLAELVKQTACYRLDTGQDFERIPVLLRGLLTSSLEAAVPKAFTQPLTQKTSPEANLLFLTARVRMTTETADRIRTIVQQEVNWIFLIQLALQHETTALLYWNLQRICPDNVPAGILEPLAARYKAQAAEAQHRAQELVRILGAVDQGIFALGYKGPILAQRLYGDLSLREFSRFSDLDVMIHECDLPKAQAVILEQGYREQVRSERELIFRERNGERMLELHWHFTTHLTRVPDDPKNFLSVSRSFRSQEPGCAACRSRFISWFCLCMQPSTGGES